MTHATAGVPVRIVAVPSFDPTTIADDSLSVAADQPSRIIVAVAVCVPALLAAYLMLRRVQRKLDPARASSPELAQRYRKTVGSRAGVGSRLAGCAFDASSGGGRRGWPDHDRMRRASPRLVQSYDPSSACVAGPKEHITASTFDSRAPDRGAAERLHAARLGTTAGRIDAG